MAKRPKAWATRRIYEFIKAHRQEHDVQTMCRTLEGYEERLLRLASQTAETCSKHRVARLMQVNKIRALHGYRTRHYSSGKPSVLIPDLVKRNFDVSHPNKIWVTDITYSTPRRCRSPPH